MSETETKKGKLTKLTDDVFEGRHPNRVYAGQIREGIWAIAPKVGQAFLMWPKFNTSTVTEILSDDGHICTFKTLNSTYKLEY